MSNIFKTISAENLVEKFSLIEILKFSKISENQQFLKFRGLLSADVLIQTQLEISNDTNLCKMFFALLFRILEVSEFETIFPKFEMTTKSKSALVTICLQLCGKSFGGHVKHFEQFCENCIKMYIEKNNKNIPNFLNVVTRVNDWYVLENCGTSLFIYANRYHEIMPLENFTIKNTTITEKQQKIIDFFGKSKFIVLEPTEYQEFLTKFEITENDFLKKIN